MVASVSFNPGLLEQREERWSTRRRERGGTLVDGERAGERVHVDRGGVERRRLVERAPRSASLGDARRHDGRDHDPPSERERTRNHHKLQPPDLACAASRPRRSKRSRAASCERIRRLSSHVSVSLTYCVHVSLRCSLLSRSRACEHARCSLFLLLPVLQLLPSRLACVQLISARLDWLARACQ